MELPPLPSDFTSVIALLNKASSRSQLYETIQPYIEYETRLRHIFAQEPHHEALRTNHLVPIFGNEQLLVNARDLDTQSDVEKGKYLLALPDSKRRSNRSPAIINDLKEFKTNFNIFSEQSLADVDWSNIVVAGSSALTPLLPVDEPHNESKRALRTYYHEKLAPASDVDVFIYGLNEEQAIEKIKSIERIVRDSILTECSTIRTKNAITIVSEYPTRHVQIILRLYKSITEILTGFDVDCSCVAFDGEQVWASPRALAAFATQQNRIDLTRRSPSYENRLSKYSHRGFEVFWPSIDRSRIDPTIFERAFSRVEGLARLLVLEKLPHPSDRDAYSDKRRKERGRPELPWNARYRHALPGNVKDAQPDDVPDWLEDTDHSDYHTFTIPYGPRYNAKRVEKLLFKQDLLLNAEWNKPKDRKTDLHRHPAFFGSVQDVLQDCCGFCPAPVTDEDLKAQEEESKHYISGELHFMRDDPGRQAIGSFNPLTTDDWTKMAYVGSTTSLCQAIVDNDFDTVKEWFGQEGIDVNHRDHTGRTPLQLACMCASAEIVELLVERGARIVSRIYNGMTALHMAAYRGHAGIVKILLDRSEVNREEEDRKEAARVAARRTAANQKNQDEEINQDSDEDIEMVDQDDDESNEDDAMTEGSFVKITEKEAEHDNEDEPDVYDIDVLAWDSPVSPLHLAIMAGHNNVIKVLINTYSADAMLPVEIKDYYSNIRTILNLELPLQMSSKRSSDTIRTLLSNGASLAQADAGQKTNFHRLVEGARPQIIDTLDEVDRDTTRKLVNHIVVGGWQGDPVLETPLFTAIKAGDPDMVRKLLALGAETVIGFDAFAKAYTQKFENVDRDPDRLKEEHRKLVEQPIIEMTRRHQLVDIISDLVSNGIDVNTISRGAQTLLCVDRAAYNLDVKSLLDLVRIRIAELARYESEKEDPPQKPDNLPESNISEDGTYHSWILSTNYRQAQALHQEQISRYEKELNIYQTRDTTGHLEKQQAIVTMLKKWLALEAKLLQKGAKTFDELHPGKRKDENDSPRPFCWNVGRSAFNRDKPFENKVSFSIPDLAGCKTEDYIELFNAVYAGDEETVKQLCVSAETPLRIAVTDSAGFSPFSLAVVREHYGLARTVLDISAAQYQPRKEEMKTYRYSIRRPEDDYDSEYYSNSEDDGDDDDDNFKVYKQLVDEKRTIDDIRLLSDTTKARTAPATLFGWHCELWRMSSMDETRAKGLFGTYEPFRWFSPSYDDEKTAWGWFNEMLSRELNRNSFSLFRFAIVSNNMYMLKFLLSLSHDLCYRKEESATLQKLQLSSSDFEIALRLGRLDMVSEIIRQTGMLLPLDDLAEKTGVQIDERPQYYQGLSVYGQKRKDWAQQDRNKRDVHNVDRGSPLLAAIFAGNIQTVEYFLSETPLRCYEEFTKKYESDKKIRALARAEGGIERALHSWMDARSDLAIHMAVMAHPVTSKPVREFLIRRMPQYLDVKSKEGLSPLHVAFLLSNYDAAKELIDAGADQTTRDNGKENLLHAIYVNDKNTGSMERLQKFTRILNQEILPSLAVQRGSRDGENGRTPLMSFLNQKTDLTAEDKDVINFMLEISKEKELEVMNGAGDYPLHSLLRSDAKTSIAKHIADRRPDLLMRENATGMTPLEVIENAFFVGYFGMTTTYGSLRSTRSATANITEIAPKDFLDPSALQPRGMTSPAKECHDVLSEIAMRRPSPRVLVSLLDANETARRLAEQQQKANQEMKELEAKGLSQHQLYYRQDNQPGKEDDSDEVGRWMLKATQLKTMAPIPTTNDLDRKHGGIAPRIPLASKRAS